MTEQICKVMDELKPVIFMVVVNILLTGMNIFYSLAADRNLNLRILIAYRWIFASAFLVPLAFIIERNRRPKLTWVVVFQAVLCGFFGGAVSQNMYAESIALISATYVSALSNLAPALTLIFAVSFRMENLKLKTAIGKAKLIGTLIEIGGAMLLTFYKGIEISIWSIDTRLLKHHQQNCNTTGNGINSLGSFLAFFSVISYTLWLIVQGILSTGVMVILVAWCVRVRGPVFVANFNPLSLLLTATMESLLIGRKMYIGSILGAGLIVCGLYMVLWGKAKEMKEKAEEVQTTISPKSGTDDVILQGDRGISKEDSKPKENYSQNELKSASKEDNITTSNNEV